MPRGRKKSLKFKLKTGTFKSIVGIFFVFFCSLSYVAFILPDYSVNTNINEIYRKLFGYSGYLVPIMFALTGFLMIGFRWRILQARIFIGIFSIIMSLSALLHVFYSEREAYRAAFAGLGGGLVGYKLSSGLASAISGYGAFFVYTFTLLAGVLLISDTSTENIISFVNSIIDRIKSVTIPSLSLKLPFGNKSASMLQTTNGNGDSVVINEVIDAAGQKKDAEVMALEIIPPPSEPVSVPVHTVSKDNSGGATHLTTLASSDRDENKLPYTNKVWEYPPKELLTEGPNITVDTNEVKRRQKIIEETLRSFGIKVNEEGYTVGPTVTQYAFEVPAGTRVTKISNLQVNLAMALESPTGSVRLEIPIPGRNAMGVEVPNSVKNFVYFKDMLLSDPMKALKSKIGVVLGKDVSGQVRVYDIGKMPHMLVAGATGSGKSVFLHSIMFSLLFRASPQEVKFILVDPKRVELVNYNGIPHLITPVITDMEKAPSAFRWACKEMERRLKLFESARVRNIDAYNEKSGFQALPYIIIMVDELAHLMGVDANSIEKSIQQLGQISRATGIHMILTVQRPSTDILTGVIKANIPCRIAFNVASQIDSRVIIDQAGAEKLAGRGDMLFVPPDASKPVRIQGSWISDGEINKLVDWVKNTGFIPEYKEEILETPDDDKKPGLMGDDKELDDYYEKAKDIVTMTGKASVSFLQRRLSIGYARAARLMDQLQDNGVVSAPDSSKERRVLISSGNDNRELDFVDNFGEQ